MRKKYFFSALISLTISKKLNIYKYKYWTFNFAQNSIFTFLIKMIANSEKNLLIQQYIYIYFLYQSNRLLHFSQGDLSWDLTYISVETQQKFLHGKRFQGKIIQLNIRILPLYKYQNFVWNNSKTLINYL